ncbi:MAG TPA: head maturation protease, ClpP-related [Spirochaetia bacterium]|nr:head maturation protease, ClpP-related [Spirochaetia bacterium]
MPYPNHHSCRLEDPAKYDKFARKNCEQKHDGKCIDVIYGIKDDKSEIQAYRYDKEVWTEADAKKHCQDHDGTFEPAEESDAIRFPEKPELEKLKWYAMETEDEVGEISIFDQIGGWFGVSVDEFKKDFDAIKKKKQVKLLLSSPGGDVSDGMAIYNLLSGIREKLSIEVMGVAASIASIVALSGKELVMGEGSYLMIHDPWSWTIGDAKEMRRIAGVLDKMGGQLANIYARNSNLSLEEVVGKMGEETWFTAEEAVEAGFADSVVEYGEVAALAFDMDKFHYNNIPDRIKQLAALAVEQNKQEPIPAQSGEDKSNNTGEETLDTLTKILEAFSELSDEEKAKMTAEDRKAVTEIFGFEVPVVESTDLTETVENLQAKVALQGEQIDLLLNEKQEVSKELANLKKEKLTTEKTQVIEQALSEGRITPKNRERWEDQYDRDPEGTKNLLEKQEPVVDLSVRGTGAGGEEPEENPEVSEKNRAAYKKMGLSDEQIDKRILGKREEK